MKKIFRIAIVILFAGTVMVSYEACGNGNQANVVENEKAKDLIITENGIEPFVLGQSIKDIPSKGEFYDNITMKTSYGGFKGDHYVEFEENEVNDYIKEWGEKSDFIGTAIVYSEGDTLMVIGYDEAGIIYRIEVWSNKIKIDNGICVGLSSEELFSKYGADFITTNCYPGGDCWQFYNVPTISENYALRVHKYQEGDNEWYWNVIEEPEPNPSTFKCIKKVSNGNPPLFKVPLEYVKDCSLEKIVIMKGGHNIFKIK